MIPKEIDEQTVFFDAIAWSYKARSDFRPMLLFATFNGEIWRSAKKLERAGLVKGVVDILYLQPRGGYSYFACELKRINLKGKALGGRTIEELAWMNEARKANAFVFLAHGADQALEKFAEYMAMRETVRVTITEISDSHLGE